MTGGTGLVGSALLRAAPGPVRALYRTAPPPKAPAAIDWIKGDLSDAAALERLCEGADALVHIAGATAATDDNGFHAVNVVGAANAAAAAVRAGVDRIVLVSSQAAERPHLSRYAASKAMGEAAVLRAVGDKADVAIVRPPAVFGPGDEATAPILSALSKGLLPVPGGKGWADRRFALVTASDLADVLVRIARDGAPGIAVPASYPALSWRDLAEASGRDVRILPVPPSILRLAGRAADLTARLTGRPSVFGLGKAAEMTQDWRVDGSGLANLPLAEALQPLLSPMPGRVRPVSAAPVTEGSP